MFVIRRVQSFKVLTNNLKSSKFHSRNQLLNKSSDKSICVELNGEQHNFPNVWLRDNCQCPDCFHQSAKSRIVDWSKFNVDIKPRNVNKDADTIQITWDDGHTSKFTFNWLKLRSFNTKEQAKYNQMVYRPKQITWRGDEFQEILSKHDYNQILNSESALHQWLQQLSIYGVALIKNTPNSETAVDAIVEKIGFTKRTHYGVKFIVQHVPNTSNVAYLSNNLQMHTDLPYYEHCPGVNMLHCLMQTESVGGDNLLSDAHYVARYMKKEHPVQYKILTDTDIEWSDIGVEDDNEFYKLYRSPVICLDKHGQIIRINFSVPQRGNHFPGPLDAVVPWYEAHSLFLELNHKFSAKFKTAEGDILVFDNIRLLHGRNAYEDSNINIRKLIGAYVDWDEIYSRLRCLNQKLYPVPGL